ncbi:MAG: hypothetical protein OEW21_16800 [Betaproteobacteria bacterium]|nr:hypothetical protein [Betaproteobacteria bacterium]
MPAWLIPALKAVLPHLGTIVSTAAPVFTKKSADAAAGQASLLQQQVTELQAAASRNDAHIKELAAQIQRTVEAFDKGLSVAERKQQPMRALCIVTTVLSLASLGIALFVLLVR